MNQQFDGGRALVRNDRRVARDAKERLTVDLRRRILTLELEPGVHLDETGLSQEYGISRTPLRDVFRQLAGEGYIQLRDNRGAVVAPMSHTTLKVFLQTAPMVYAAVSRLAVENATEAQIGQLREAQEVYREAVEGGEPNDVIYANDQFHMVIGQMAANPYLLPALQRLLIDHARIGQSFWQGAGSTMQESLKTAAEQHDRLIEAIANRDIEEAVAVTMEHWQLSREHLERIVRPEPLPVEPAER